MRALAYMLTVLALAGCDMSRFHTGTAAPPPPPIQPDQVRLPFVVHSATQPDDGFDPVVSHGGFQVFCDVLMLDAPAGALSQSGQLWRHLREDALGSSLAEHMARNGFRVGVGKPADFATVSNLLSTSRDTKMRTGRLIFQSQNAIEMVLDAEPRLRRPFVYSPAGAVSGSEYPAGMTFYWVAAWHDIERIDSVNLTLVPEIRFGRDRPRVYRPGMPRRDEHRDVGRLFTEVKLEVALARGEFVVLAPRANEGAALVLGRSLLYNQTNQTQPRELVLLIRPRVARAPG